MTAQFLTRDQLLLAEIQATAGTAESPTAAANAIRCLNLRVSPQFEVDQGDAEHTSSLDPGEPVVLGGRMRATFGVRLAGSGSAGSAPEWGAVLRGCGFAETLTASDIDDTAQAGAASTITLHSGASATDDAYNGMVITLDGGTGSGQTRVITDYVGSTKVATVMPAWDTEPDNTSEFVIHANALYEPASSDLEDLTLWGYQNSNQSGVNSRVRKMDSAAGTFTLEMGTRQIPQFGFTFDGKLTELPTNVARPTGVAYDDTLAPPFRNADAYLGAAAVKFSRFSLNLGGQVAMPDDPGDTYGMDRASLTARAIGGSISAYLKLLTTRNVMSDFIAGTERAIWLRWGSTAGNRFSLLIPAARYNGNPEETSEGGFEAENAPFRAIGADTGMALCCY